MARRDYVQFEPGFFERIGKSAPVDRLAGLIAQRVLGLALAAAPVDTGDYKRGLRIERIVAENRVVYRVVAGDEKSMLVEAKRGTLARALRAGTRR